MPKKIKALAAKVNDYVASVVRTVVMLGVSWLLAWAGRHGLDIDVSQGTLALISGAVYYTTVRAMEHYINPRFGWLFGLAKKPVYSDPEVTEDA